MRDFGVLLLPELGDAPPHHSRRVISWGPAVDLLDPTSIPALEAGIVPVPDGRIGTDVVASLDRALNSVAGAMEDAASRVRAGLLTYEAALARSPSAVLAACADGSAYADGLDVVAYRRYRLLVTLIAQVRGPSNLSPVLSCVRFRANTLPYRIAFGSVGSTAPDKLVRDHIDETRASRAHWLATLRDPHHAPTLVSSGIDIRSEALFVVQRVPKQRVHWYEKGLRLDDVPAGPTLPRGERAAIAVAARETLLRQFAVGAVAKLVPQLGERWHHTRWLLLLAGGSGAGTVVAVTLAALGAWEATATPAILAMAAYGLLAVAVLVGGPLVGYPTLLRMPAAAAIGQAAIAASPDGWGHATSVRLIMTAVVFVAVATIYLMVEARMVGDYGPGQAVKGGGTVAAIGVAHSFLVAVILTEWLVPLTVAVGVLGPGGAGGNLPHVLLLSGVGLAAGVLLEVLWQDNPATYPINLRG